MDMLTDRKGKLEARRVLTRAQNLGERFDFENEDIERLKPAQDAQAEAFYDFEEREKNNPSEGLKDKRPSALDRTIDSIERHTSFYLSNQGELYRIYCGFSGLSHASVLVLSLITVARYGTDLNYLTTETYGWIGIGLVYHAVMIALGFAIKYRIHREQPRGVTLMATHIGLQLFSLSIFSMLIGLWTLFNPSFRAETKSWTPSWFSKLEL